MSLNIKKLQLSFDGSLFCNAAVSGMNAKTLRYSFDGSIWWCTGGSIETIITGNVKRILKVDWPAVKTIINVEG